MRLLPNTGGRRGLSGKQLALILRYTESPVVWWLSRVDRSERWV